MRFLRALLGMVAASLVGLGVAILLFVRTKDPMVLGLAFRMMLIFWAVCGALLLLKRGGYELRFTRALVAMLVASGAGLGLATILFVRHQDPMMLAFGMQLTIAAWVVFGGVLALRELGLLRPRPGA